MPLELYIICATAFCAATLTFFSGFGLSTILTPVLMLFFPTETAVALAGVVHLVNNVFKVFVVGRHANLGVLIRFGIPAVLSAFIGAWLLLQLAGQPELFSYRAFGSEFFVSPVKFIVAILLIAFASLELIPKMRNLKFGANKLPLGGVLSGFFGGLTGNQGALRSAFLIRAGLHKEAFVGTAVVASVAVDLTRLGVYSTQFLNLGLIQNAEVVAAATLAAILGTVLGNALFKKVTMTFIQITVAIMLIVISLALGLGLL